MGEKTERYASIRNYIRSYYGKIVFQESEELMKATFKTVVLKIMFYMATGLTAWFAGYGFGTFLKDLEKED